VNWRIFLEQESTTHLLDVLKNVQKEDINQFNRKHIAGQLNGFPAFMDSIISQKKLKRQDIFQKADLPQKYGYKLLSGETHTTNRDKLLRIFIAMNMSLKETQRALELYGLATLYPKKKRDAILIIAINKGISSVDTVNEWLSEHGEPELCQSQN
jgi:hypothetical protein